MLVSQNRKLSKTQCVPSGPSSLVRAIARLKANQEQKENVPEITTDWFIDAARFSEHLLHGRPCVGGGAVNKVRCKLFSLVGNEMGKQLVHTILGTGKG